MKKINLIYLIGLFFLSNWSFGQVTIERQVIGSTGQYSVGSTMSISSTVGEAFVQSLFSVNRILTQGFQQPEDINDAELKFYTGITPNGDDKNDVWIIDGIEQYPVNKVKIFNRWGQQVWSAEGYDNTSIVWKGNSDGEIEMSTGTYFYVADVDGQTYSGWVELTR